MPLLLKTARVIGSPSELAWAQAHTIGNLFLVIVLQKKTNEAETNLAVAGKELLLKITESYETQGIKNLASFRLMIEEVIQTPEDIKIASFAIGMVSGNALYVGVKDGTVFLKRRETLAPILQGKEDLTCASGILQEGDQIFLLSKETTAFVEEETTKELLATIIDPQEIAEALSARLYKEEEQDKLAMLIVWVGKSYEADAEEEHLIVEEKEEEPVPVGKSRFTRAVKIMRSTLRLVLGLFRGKTRRVVITVFIVLFVLLFLSLILGVNKRKEEQARTRFTAVFSEASEKLDQGLALADLNPQLSAKTLSEAKGIVEKALPEFSDKRSKEELTALEKKIDDGLQKALHIQNFSDVPVFFDLTLIKDGAVGVQMVLVDGKALVLDNKNGVLYTLTVSQKQAELVSGNIGDGKFATIAEGLGFVLDKDGVERIIFKTKKREKVVASDSEWGDIGGLATFGGNLYLLDKGKASIYKYQAGESGFSSKRNYLGPGIAPDFSNTVSMVIDGSVWVLFSDGRISKFVQGAPQPFSIQGIDIALSNPKAIFTNDENKYLYILDSSNKRVVVVAKDGFYNAQYKWEGIQNVTDLVASEKEKKLLLLSGSKIYGIDL